MNGTNTLTAIVMPAWNESSTIARVVLAGRRHWQHVIVVDDSSDDETAVVAERAGARVVRHPTRLGYGGALRSGLMEALRFGVDAIVTLDADGAHDPDQSPALVAEHLRSGADLTLGSRFGNGQGEWFPTAKRDANRLGRTIFNAVHGSAFSDVASGYRVLSRRLASGGLESLNFAAAFEILARALTRGWKVHEVPITVRYDAAKPFCTGRGELSNFLAFCSEGARGALRENLLEFLAAIDQMTSCTVMADEEEFNLHFFAEFDAYIIQRQNPWYIYAKQYKKAIDLNL